ncbi:MAG: hypothetical protein HOC74_25750 [Gemmatimonadetes bacterium]|jgi:hypothetical protein|nr:hypothetical protein [Gemmatimonadota bacterium]
MSCGYHFWVGDLTPVDGEEQSPGITVSDDGTVTFVKERLELAVRPLTVEELNRQLPGRSVGGIESTNPYTYGDWKDPKTGQIPERFTVFLLKVKNYSYPKVQVDPMMVSLTTDVGMTYLPLGKLDLETFYRPYITGYAGVPFLRFKERESVARATLYPPDMVFSGQEKEGYLVFPSLHHQVRTVQLNLSDVVLRFDFRDEPLETIDVEYGFHREIGRLYRDGRLVMNGQPN